ncbi:MAG: GntR family transcriptional regulator [Candidatus Rokuibacteriota bacterium]|nr:MAG: GntR family transcriptional regulator [Candidatus Rokubacteria bacterium]
MTRAVKRRKSDRVLNDLGMQIVSGQRAPGDRLPREHDLSRRLGISRPSLREGLKALVQKGLIEPRTGRGTTINEKHRWNVLDADVLRWIAEAPPDREFYRTLLEARPSSSRPPPGWRPRAPATRRSSASSAPITPWRERSRTTSRPVAGTISPCTS